MTSVEFILLHYTKYGENSLVLHTLSKEYGRRGFFLKGALSKKSSMALFQPLNILEADIQENSKGGLLPARNVSASYPLAGIRSNVYKNTIVLFMAEVLFRSIKEGCFEDGLYEWVEKDILLLDALHKDFSNFHIRFLLDYASRLGFNPQSQDLSPFLGEHNGHVVEFMNADFARSMMMPFSGLERNEIANGLLRYIEYHIDSAMNINSLKILHEIFI